MRWRSRLHFCDELAPFVPSGIDITDSGGAGSPRQKYMLHSQLEINNFLLILIFYPFESYMITRKNTHQNMATLMYRYSTEYNANESFRPWTNHKEVAGRGDTAGIVTEKENMTFRRLFSFIVTSFSLVGGSGVFLVAANVALSLRKRCEAGCRGLISSLHIFKLVVSQLQTTLTQVTRGVGCLWSHKRFYRTFYFPVKILVKKSSSLQHRVRW